MKHWISRLQEEFGRLSQGQGFVGLNTTFQTLKVGPCAKNAFLECQANGRQVTLNPTHPIYQKLDRKGDRSRVYFLLSAIVSVVNRADTQLHDADERRFHALMLQGLSEESL